MATVIRISTSNVSNDINGNKKKNIANDENNVTIEKPYNDSSKCELKLFKMSIVMSEQ